MQCPPQTKLPALYLLDSISKNIGPPYIVLFSRFIERRFLEAYQVVDSPTKIKMEELLGTWRTGGSDGGELFRLPDEGRGGRVQRGIETALFGAGGRGGGIGGGGRALRENESYQSGVRPSHLVATLAFERGLIYSRQMQQLPAPATQGERSGVLFDVRRLLQLRHDQALANPEDAVNSSQIVALQKVRGGRTRRAPRQGTGRLNLSHRSDMQLESLVLGTQLTSDQVYQIRGQLAILAPREPEPEVLPSLTAAVSSVPYDDSATGAPASSSAAHALDNPTPYLPPTPPTPSLPLASHQGIDLNLLAQLQGPGKLAELLAMTAPPVAPVAPSSIFQQQPPAQTPAAPLLPQADKLTKEYEDAIVQLNVHLNNADILKYVPSFLSSHASSLTAFSRRQISARGALVPLRPFRPPVQAVWPPLLRQSVWKEADGRSPRLALYAQATDPRGSWASAGTQLAFARGGAFLLLSLVLVHSHLRETVPR